MCSWASRADRDGRRAPSSTDSWPPFPVPPSSLCSWVLTCSKGFGEARCGRPKPSGLRPTGRGARAVHLKQEPVWGPGAGLPLCPAGLETVAEPGAPAVPSRDIPAPGRGRPWPPRGCIWSQVPITSSGPAGGRTEGRHGFQNASGLSDAASSRVRRGRRRGTSYQTRRRRRLGHARPVVGTRRRGQVLRPGGRLAEGSSRVRSPGPGSSRAGTSRCRR